MPINPYIEDIISRRAWHELLGRWEESELRHFEEYVGVIEDLLADAERAENIAMLAATIIDGIDTRDVLQAVHDTLGGLSNSLVEAEKELERLSRKVKTR